MIDVNELNNSAFADDVSLVYENDSWYFIHVKTYTGAIFCNSAECGGVEAKWCIGNPDYKNDWIYHSEKRNEKFILALNKNAGDTANRKWMLVFGETIYCCNQDNDGFTDVLTLSRFKVDVTELQKMIKTSV